MFSGIAALFSGIWKGLDFLFGLVAFIWVPVIVSALFCLFTGIPFTKFWGVVFKVFNQCFSELLSYCTIDGFHKMQHWFFNMVF